MKPVTESALLTDLYQLSMLQAYLDAGMTDTAVFELFVRKLPKGRNFLLAAGLEQVLAHLESLSLTRAEIAWLERAGGFNRRFLDFLAGLRFTGDVHAMPEGTAFFPDEPIIRVTAPIMQAQLAETRIINLMNLETIVASKAVRSVLAAPGKLLVDFGLRRAHGAEAGLLAARAAYLAGFDGSSTVLAGARFGIPVLGTMAHSFIQAHQTEREAFTNFALSRPRDVTFLLDTYDTEAAARKLVEIAPGLKARGVTLRSVRLDSGDLAALAFAVRAILDEGGLKEVGIFASGGLDEQEIARLLAAGAPIDGFGVGTALVVSADAPALDCAYKLQEYAGQPRRKRSAGKATWPGRKQVFRSYGSDGRMLRDVLAVEGDAQSGEPLVTQVMAAGKRLAAPEPLDAARARVRREIARLPEHLKKLEDSATPMPVEVTPALRALADAVDRIAR
jgi:nicotinate phosphoribosyltransferase